MFLRGSVALDGQVQSCQSLLFRFSTFFNYQVGKSFDILRKFTELDTFIYFISFEFFGEYRNIV